MLAPRITLSASHKGDIATICALGSPVLNKIIGRIEADGFTIRRSKIERSIKDVAGEADGSTIARVLFGIASTFRRFLMSPEDALDQVARSLGDGLDNDPRFKNWNECRASLKQLLGLRQIALAAKALDVSYDFERVYLAGRLLTSIRPVFDPPRDDIVGTTIVQTLRMEFLAPNGDQSSITVAMDMDDIRQLKTECEYAIKKASRAQSRIVEQYGMEAIIPGEEDSE